MVNDQSTHQRFGAEPSPSFASDADIEFAEVLRHRIEEKFLGDLADPLYATPEPGHGFAPSRLGHAKAPRTGKSNA